MKKGVKKTMKKTIFPKRHIPYVAKALNEQGIGTYEINSGGSVLVPEKVSNKKLKICRRRAWAFYMSDLQGIRYLTREDAGKSVSGIIPEAEKRFF